MRKQQRDRKTVSQDRKSGHEMMAENKPSASAARQYIHKAYQSYTVDGYLNKLGVDTKGEVNGCEKF